MRWLDGIIDSMDMSLSRLWEWAVSLLLWGPGAWCPKAGPGVARAGLRPTSG